MTKPAKHFYATAVAAIWAVVAAREQIYLLLKDSKWIIAVSLVVAVSAALDGFFRFGDRWRTFRRTSELLKAQGWQYFELSGPYAGTNHAGAFTAFAGHVESLIQEDVKAFITQVTPTRQAHDRPEPDHEVPDQPRSAPTG